MEDLLEDLEVSIVNDLAIFRSDLLLDAYKSMWTWESGDGGQDFDVYNTFGYLAQEVLGDNYDYLYTSAYNDVPALLCTEQTNEADCTHVDTCEWQEDQTCLSAGYKPDCYFGHHSQGTVTHAQWGPYFYPSKLKGVVRYNYKREAINDPNASAYELFNTHFHELAHDFLVET